MANKQTLLRESSKVEHCGQNDEDGAKTLHVWNLEKVEMVFMRERKKGNRRRIALAKK